MPQTTLPLVPWPARVLDANKTIELSGAFRVQADAPLVDIADLLVGRLENCTGYPVALQSYNARYQEREQGQYPIYFKHSEDLPCKESYRVYVGVQGARIEASAHAGAYYGMQTLLQLMPPAVYSKAPRHDVKWTIALATVEDSPRLRWRGVMLDSARTFQPLEFVYKFIDLISQHRINILHWHLTDDQGWRLEIKKYPKLTQIGSVRAGTQVSHAFHPRRNELGNDNTPVGGFYTQDEVREVIAYAALRGVNIVPEIEMPGHANAAVAAYPEFGLWPEPAEVNRYWGVHKSLFSVRPQALSFLRDVLDEVVALFPFQYVHIGGDEAVKDQWQADDYAQKLIKELGLKDETQLQGWFTGQMAQHLKSHGRKLVGWDEILEGDNLPKGSTVMSWRGAQGAIRAAETGFDAVMSSQKALYFDYYQGPAEEEPLCIGRLITLPMVHAFDPVPEGLTKEQGEHVIGVQAQLWTEYIPNTSRLEYMAFPRVCALAEISWSQQQRPDYAHFVDRLQTHLLRLDCQDVRYRALRQADLNPPAES